MSKWHFKITISKISLLNLIPQTSSSPKFSILFIGLSIARFLRPKFFLLSSLVLTLPASHIHLIFKPFVALYLRCDPMVHALSLLAGLQELPVWKFIHYCPLHLIHFGLQMEESFKVINWQVTPQLSVLQCSPWVLLEEYLQPRTPSITSHLPTSTWSHRLSPVLPFSHVGLISFAHTCQALPHFMEWHQLFC